MKERLPVKTPKPVRSALSTAAAWPGTGWAFIGISSSSLKMLLCMNNNAASKHFTFCFLSLLAFAFAQSQDKPAWQANFQTEVHWYMPTATGLLLVSSREGLHGVDPEKHDTVWHLPKYGVVDASRFKSMPGTPYLELGGLMSVQEEADLKADTNVKTAVKNFFKGFGEHLSTLR